jgi:hypothetical protein
MANEFHVEGDTVRDTLAKFLHCFFLQIEIPLSQAPLGCHQLQVESYPHVDVMLSGSLAELIQQWFVTP